MEYIFDAIETVGTVWLGLTMTCARCHDHKFDPVSQRNYYQLFAYFNQTPVTGGGGDPQTPPVLTVRSESDSARLTSLEAEVARVERARAARRETLLPRQTAWERGFLRAKGDRRDAWSALVPASASSGGGQRMEIQADRAVLVGGKNPSKDVYTVEYGLPAGRFTGLRLDALRHSSMTQGGLARSNSGNFVLTELEVKLKSTGSVSAVPVKIASGSATFEQGGFPIQGAFDGRSDTGWAVYPGRPLTQPHAAVFRFAEPLNSAVPSTLVVTMRHESVHVSHNIGHFRLSVSTRDRPDLADKAAALVKALRVQPGQRTKADSKLVEAHYLGSDSTYFLFANRLTFCLLIDSLFVC